MEYENDTIKILSEERADERKKIIEQIEKMKETEEEMKGLPLDEELGYNQAIEDLINLLKK